MQARGLSDAAVLAALDHGRVIHTRGAAVHVIGHREVSYCRLNHDLDLTRFEGVQVVVAQDDTIITVYRNRDLRGLRPRRRRRVWRAARWS